MTPMNVRPLDEARPRLICRVARQWHALFPLHRLGHLSSCPGCQSHLKAERSLELSLRQNAFDSREEVGATDGLERDILRAIRAAGPASSQTRPKPAYRAWTMGGLGAIAAIVVLMAGLRREPVAERHGVAVAPVAPALAAATPEVVAIIETVDALSENFVDSVLPKAGGLVAKNPLQKEFTSVYSDMRSALDFLALNFLPVAPATASPVAPPATRRI